MTEVDTHRQVWVKVNAHVDEGIADLIRALVSFLRLRTLESCQSTAQARGGWVCFRYGEDQPGCCRGLANFVVGYLGPGLAREVGDLANVAVVVTTCGQAQGEIAVRSGAMARVVRTVRQLAREFGG